MINIKKFLAFLIYYGIINLGLFCACWIVYARFIRNRTIKDIPLALSEYGFWVLLYLCLLYLFSIIILIANKTPNDTIKILMDIVYKPMIMLDHLIKYNKYVKIFTYNILEKLISILSNLKKKFLLLITIFFQIIPRVILIVFLFIDIWVLHHIEVFYNVILIGLIPFIYRYIKYTFKDLKQQYILILEEKYETVWMIEIDTEESVKYDTEITIEDYIKFKTNQKIYKTGIITSNDYIYDINKEYNEAVMSKEATYTQYRKENNIPAEIDLTDKDYQKIRQLFNTLMPKIMLLSVFLEKYSIVENHKIIKWAKVIIFGLYFISWGYVLLISCYTYPVTFENTVYNLMQTLLKIEEPFSGTRS